MFANRLWLENRHSIKALFRFESQPLVHVQQVNRFFQTAFTLTTVPAAPAWVTVDNAGNEFD
ncbi:hypothetical protein OK016_29200 [Vibrio chagasii]|nr:hypothetical protein [Vibrio chagasii]